MTPFTASVILWVPTSPSLQNELSANSNSRVSSDRRSHGGSPGWPAWSRDRSGGIGGRAASRSRFNPSLAGTFRRKVRVWAAADASALLRSRHTAEDGARRPYPTLMRPRNWRRVLEGTLAFLCRETVLNPTPGRASVLASPIVLAGKGKGRKVRAGLTREAQPQSVRPLTSL